VATAIEHLLPWFGGALADVGVRDVVNSALERLWGIFEGQLAAGEGLGESADACWMAAHGLEESPFNASLFSYLQGVSKGCRVALGDSDPREMLTELNAALESELLISEGGPEAIEPFSLVADGADLSSSPPELDEEAGFQLRVAELLGKKGTEASRKELLFA
jgi:hypothetical protein